MTTLKIRKSVIAIAVASALGIMAPSAHALTITATTNATVGALSDSDSQTASTGSVFSNSDIWTNNGGGYDQYAWANSDGDDSGQFAGSVTAGEWSWRYYDDSNNSGQFSTPITGSSTPISATSYYSFSDEYTNTSGVAQQYDLGFYVDQGSLSLGLGFGGPLASSNFSSSYSLDILLNGSSIWGSSANLSASGLTEAGTSLNGTLSSSYYQWDEFFGNLDLGVVEAGESFTLQYVMDLNVGGTCGFDGCEGGAQIGDPFSLGTNPLHSPTVSMSPTSVPEPSTLALLGLGLAGVVVAGKRRRK